MPIAPDQDFLPVLDQTLVEQRASTRYNNTTKGAPTTSWVASYSLQSQIAAPEPGSPTDLGAPTARAAGAATAMVTAPARLTISARSYDATIQADGPVGYWPLNETSGTTATDSTGNGHTGTYSGGVTPHQPGIGDGETAAVFDGTTGQVSVPNSTAFVPPQASFECWINFTTTPSTSYPGFISNEVSNNGYALYWNSTSGAVVAFQVGGASPALDTSGVVGGTWYHFVGTFDGTNARLYRNGILVSTTTPTVSLAAAPLTIGTQSGGYFFGGRIAKAAVYNYALTPTQIATHYLAAKPATYDAGVLGDVPVAYWPLNETTGTTATDASGNSNTGTYTGGVTLNQTGIGDSESAVSFNGATGIVETTTLLAGPTAVSLEAWVKTSAVAPGPVIGFNALQDGSSATHDRILYFHGTSGSILWGTGASAIVTSPSAYDDGNWHHVVAIGDQTGNSTILYVDGVSVATLGSTNFAAYNGYWVVGSINTGGFTGGSATWFTGTMAKVAVYNYVLTSTQVAAHHAAQTSAPAATAPLVVTAASATIIIAAPPAMLTATALAVGVATATVTAAAKLTPTAAAIAQATAIAQTTAPLTATAQATGASSAALYASALLAATAQVQAQASATTTAPAAITPTAAAVGQAQVALTVSARLTPSAQAIAQASSQAQTSAPITATSQTIAQATATVTSVGAQNLTATTVAVSQTTATLTATTKLAAQAQAVSSATTSTTANAQLAPAATAVTQTTATVTATATPQLTPTATAVTQAQALLLVGAALTPTAQATTATTLTATARTQLAANAAATSQTTLTLTVPGIALLTATASTTAQALALLSTRALLTATATTSTQAQTRVTAAFVTTHAWQTAATDQLLNASSAGTMQATATTTGTWAWVATATGDEDDDSTTSADAVATLVYAGYE